MNEEQKYTLLGFLNAEALKQDSEMGQLVAKEGLSDTFLALMEDILDLGVHVADVLSVEFSPDGPYLAWSFQTVEEWYEYLSHMAHHAALAAAVSKLNKGLGGK